MAGVVELVEEHGDALEADLQRFYQIELAGLFTHPPTLSIRRLRVLVRHLPHDSATRRELEADDAGWSLNEHLLALVVDAVRAGNWQRGGGKGAKPKPIPRPGHRPRSHTHGHVERGPAEVAAYLDRFKPQRELADDSSN